MWFFFLLNQRLDNHQRSLETGEKKGWMRHTSRTDGRISSRRKFVQQRHSLAGRWLCRFGRGGRNGIRGNELKGGWRGHGERQGERASVRHGRGGGSEWCARRWHQIAVGDRGSREENAEIVERDAFEFRFVAEDRFGQQLFAVLQCENAFLDGIFDDKASD